MEEGRKISIVFGNCVLLLQFLEVRHGIVKVAQPKASLDSDRVINLFNLVEIWNIAEAHDRQVMAQAAQSLSPKTDIKSSLFIAENNNPCLGLL